MFQSLKIGVANEMMLGRPVITVATTDLEHGRQTRYVGVGRGDSRDAGKRDQTRENRRGRRQRGPVPASRCARSRSIETCSATEFDRAAGRECRLYAIVAAAD